MYFDTFLKEINKAIEEEVQRQLQNNSGKTYSELLSVITRSKFDLKPYERDLVDFLQHKISEAALNSEINE